MSINNYSGEINAQIIVYLLKAHNIRNIIVSPGSTNIALVSSLQVDSFFTLYSAADERSAAYMACGMAAETGEPVVLSCTGATASRNYVSGLTEAYYRKLPILAITSTTSIVNVGHLAPQQIDRSVIQKDIAKLSVDLPIVKDDVDKWDCEIKVNTAILELKRNGGGPVHINLSTSYSGNNTVKELPEYRVINRYNVCDKMPNLPNGRIGVIVGSHKIMPKALFDSIDKFCEVNDSVVFCDHTSSYKGKYRVLYSIAAIQSAKQDGIIKPDLLIHIGEISGDYYTAMIEPKQVWRVSQDGEIRDRFRVLTNVFEMPEDHFFEYYSRKDNSTSSSYLSECQTQLKELYGKLPELPFSNIWIASVTADKIPANAAIHFGILNSLRSWNFFELPNSVSSFSNVGGFGIDGGLSSLIGASLSNKEKLYFGVIGDLAFFYDLNSLGNRHVGKNIRILLVNNGIGIEFKNFTHIASKFGQDTNELIAAAGHYGNKSPQLIKHYAEDLGFEYICASSKEEYLKVCDKFLSPKITDRPIVFEVFTNEEDESNALKLVHYIEQSVGGEAKRMAKQVLGNKGFNAIKKMLGK